MPPTIHHKYKHFHSTVQRAKDIDAKSFIFAVWRNINGLHDLIQKNQYKVFFFITRLFQTLKQGKAK